jgi:hypothetical protein
VPRWLQPGEFVVRKSVVDDLGLGFFNAVNGGQFDVAASPAALAANPSTGMALGGPVVDRGASQAASGGFAQGKTETRIVPAIVARDREMDTLVRGGSFSQMSWMRENASEINQALDRGPRRR